MVDGISKSPFGLFISQEITCQIGWFGYWGVSLSTWLQATAFKNTANEALDFINTRFFINNLIALSVYRVKILVFT